MYDLRTLEILNERAHQQAIERAAEKKVKAARMAELKQEAVVADVKPTVFPLAILYERLVVAPPLLTHLVDMFSSGEIVADFFNLVHTYIPDSETAIRAQPMNQRVASFVRFFSQAYFPLMDEFLAADTSFSELLMAIPIDCHGFTETDYHSFDDFRPGYIALMSLCETMYDELYEEYDDDDERPPGGRVALIDRMKELVGPQLAGSLPAAGWTSSHIHDRTAGTKFDKCGDFADWVIANTDFWLLNVRQVDYELDGRAGEEWEEDTVHTFADEWPLICQFWEDLNRLADLLESNLQENFRELLLLLVDDKEKIICKEQLPLPIEQQT